MPETHTCSFCGVQIEPGTGRMFVKRDGTVFHFCSKKCYKNMIVLKRVPRRTRWSLKYQK
ncbi:MAG TPA: 50S ribosomal protein L24e [Thermoplasmata archaeon]|nr:50S ribosomal protein L24e [Thermoplasmata archaeon]